MYFNKKVKSLIYYKLVNYLLDNNNIEWRFSLPNYYDLSMSNTRIGFDIDYGDNILGRYPEKDNEIFFHSLLVFKPVRIYLVEVRVYAVVARNGYGANLYL